MAAKTSQERTKVGCIYLFFLLPMTLVFYLLPEARHFISTSFWGFILSAALLSTALIVVFNMLGWFSKIMRFVISISVVVALNLLIVLLNPLRSFDAHINEYKNIPGLQQADLSSPYLTGKLIVVDISKDATDSIDSLYYQLPANLKATKAEQVKTVIWNNCVNDAVATYSNGESDFQTTCTLSIIDQAKAALVGQKEFIGPEPTGCSHYSSGTSNCFGGKPTKDELAYLSSLPQH